MHSDCRKQLSPVVMGVDVIEGRIVASSSEEAINKYQEYPECVTDDCDGWVTDDVEVLPIVERNYAKASEAVLRYARKWGPCVMIAYGTETKIEGYAFCVVAPC